MSTLLIIVSIVLYWILRNKTLTTANKQYIICITIVLIAVSGLRHECVGNDTMVYIHMYETIGSESWKDILYGFVNNYLNPLDNGEKDPGYRLFTKALSSIIPDARLYLFVVASILLIPLGVFVYRFSKTIETTLFFYVFYISLFYGYLPNSAIRQALALSFVLIAYLCLERKKLLSFAIFILIGSLMHKSCLISFLILPALKFVNERLFYKIGVVMFLIALVFSDQMALLFMDQSEIYDVYLSGSFYTGANGSRPIMVVLLFAVLYIIGWMGNSSKNIQSDKKLFYIGTTLTLIFVPLVWVNPSLLRVISYFAPFMGIVVGESFDAIPRGKLYRVVVIVVFLFHSLSAPQYKFMWETMSMNDRYAYTNIKTIDDERKVTLKSYIL